MATAIKERPIDMRDWEVRALREGRKTQTRRVINPQPKMRRFVEFAEPVPWMPVGGIHQDRWKCPYGVPGDRLWVRETWSPDHVAFYPHFPVVYRSEGIPGEWEIVAGKVHSPEGGADFPFRWRSSTQMPRRFSRNDIEVVSVRVERESAITIEDEIAMGKIPVGPPYIPRRDRLGRDISPWLWVIEHREVKRG